MNDFYVGYLNQMPARHKSWVRRFIGMSLLLALVGVVGWLFTMRELGPAVFEFGHVREFEGTIRTYPVPLLELTRPNADSTSSYLLVNPGKFGAMSAVESFDGALVTLRGTLIYRDQRTMIEILPESIQSQGKGSIAESTATLGQVTLEGEIVDSKCFLGVMNPGDLRPHQACAIRCISGGVPPVLLVRHDVNKASYYLLTNVDGGALNDAVLNHIAVPVQVKGELVQLGAWRLLKTRPQDIQSIQKR